MEQQSGHNSARNEPPASYSLLEMGIEDRDLRIEVFSICEAAVDQNGRLSVLGAFENLNVASIPCVLPHFSVALRLRFWPAEIQQHSVKFVLTNPDGQPITQVLEARGLNPAGSRERSQACNIIIQINQLPIQDVGEYSVDFYLNGQLEGRLPFCVFCDLV